MKENVSPILFVFLQTIKPTPTFDSIFSRGNYMFYFLHENHQNVNKGHINSYLVLLALT